MQQVGGIVLTPAEARSRVARGAERLDATWPDWTDRIDLRFLDIASCFQCVLAQTAGGFTLGLQDLWPSEDGDVVWPTNEHGFSLNCRWSTVAEAEEDWATLQAAWVALITARRATPALAVPDLAKQLGVA